MWLVIWLGLVAWCKFFIKFYEIAIFKETKAAEETAFSFWSFLYK